MQMRDGLAIVTGAGRGVGRATALALAREGAAVGLIGRTASTLQAVSDEIAAEGGRALPVVADVADETAIDEGVRELVGRFGPPRVLVHAAGIGVYGNVETYRLADWNATLATNLTGAFVCARAVIPGMRAGGGGAIIAIGSGASKQGYATLAAYAASKFGLLGFMQSLAAEVGVDRIKVSTILPGSIMTPFGGRSVEEKALQRLDGRAFLEPGDVAGAVLFLLSQADRAWTQELNLWPV